jgi:hypothetical protein
MKNVRYNNDEHYVLLSKQDEDQLVRMKELLEVANHLDEKIEVLRKTIADVARLMGGAKLGKKKL